MTLAEGGVPPKESAFVVRFVSLVLLRVSPCRSVLPPIVAAGACYLSYDTALPQVRGGESRELATNTGEVNQIFRETRRYRYHERTNEPRGEAEKVGPGNKRTTNPQDIVCGIVACIPFSGIRNQNLFRPIDSFIEPHRILQRGSLFQLLCLQAFQTTRRVYWFYRPQTDPTG